MDKVMRLSPLSEFHERTRIARKILVVDFGFLGDTLHLVPALCEIKRHYPQAALHVLSSVLGSELLRLAACVDRIWPMALAPGRRSLREQLNLLRALRQEQFDLAFNFGGSDREIIWTGLSGARWRVGHEAGRRHFWNRWLVPNRVPKQDPDLVILEQRRRVLAACGFRLEPARFDLRLDEASTRWAGNFIPSGAMHLSINSANPLKEWPLEHHAAMLKELWTRLPGLRVVASAGTKEREQERLTRLASGLSDARLQPLPENLSIAQLAAVLARCRLHVGPDSGVMHLAVALDVPTISFFREQGHYKSWLPVGAAHRAITVPCRCVDHHDAPCERLGRAECLAQIKPRRVVAAVEFALTEKNLA